MKTLKDFPDQVCRNNIMFNVDHEALEWKEDFEAEHEFLVAMDERVLEKQGEYGDSWKTITIAQLTQRVEQNYKEWQDLWRESDSRIEQRKLVDLANLCRFLWERLGE